MAQIDPKVLAQSVIDDMNKSALDNAQYTVKQKIQSIIREQKTIADATARIALLRKEISEISIEQVSADGILA